MCSLRLPTSLKYSWINNADLYDRAKDVAVWISDDRTKSVRYNTVTTECGLFSWDFFHHKWIMNKVVPVSIHEPLVVKELAERMLKDDKAD